MRKVIKTMIAATFITATVTAEAQDKVELSAGADIVSSYIWRGQDMAGASIQPSLGIAYKGLSLAAWGSYGLTDNDDTKELDFTLSYSLGGFSVGVTDYYCIMKGTDYADLKYFMYEAHKTAHVFEAFVGYDFGVVSVLWNTNFAGADGLDDDGDRAYSSYFEASAPFKLGGLDMSFTAGIVPWATTSYADATGFAVTNLTLRGEKSIKITPTFSIPLFASITANPSASKMYLTAGISF